MTDNFVNNQAGGGYVLDTQALKRIAQSSGIGEIVAFLASPARLDHQRYDPRGRRIEGVPATHEIDSCEA